MQRAENGARGLSWLVDRRRLGAARAAPKRNSRTPKTVQSSQLTSGRQWTNRPMNVPSHLSLSSRHASLHVARCTLCLWPPPRRRPLPPRVPQRRRTVAVSARTACGPRRGHARGAPDPAAHIGVRLAPRSIRGLHARGVVPRRDPPHASRTRAEDTCQSIEIPRARAPRAAERWC
jgi:hypothetical protein